MPTVLGKRKKPTSAAANLAAAKSAKLSKSTKTAKPTAAVADDNDAIQDIFRRHFEAQFKPLADIVKDKKKHEEKDKKNKKIKTEDDEEVAANGKTVVIRENESDEDSEEDADDDDDEAESEDDWSGLSGDEDEDGAVDEPAASAVQVVDYSAAEQRDDPTTKMSKHERKLYLSSKVPSSFDEARPKQTKQPSDIDPAAKQYKDAPELLANDLALQRLISESHLLSGAFALPSSFSTSAGAAATFGAAGTSASKNSQPFAAGRLRQRTTDLRIQAVANKAKGDGGGSDSLVTVNNAKESIFTQAKMPMAMRKGIVAAAAARETKRRQEAHESGIVLERPQAQTPKKTTKRVRAVDAPAVGVMRGSELKLRDKDIRAIEGPKKTFRGGKSNRGGKRR